MEHLRGLPSATARFRTRPTPSAPASGAATPAAAPAPVALALAGPVECVLDHILGLSDAIIWTAKENHASVAELAAIVLADFDSGAAVLRNQFDCLPALPDEHSDQLVRDLDGLLVGRLRILDRRASGAPWRVGQTRPLPCSAEHVINHLPCVLDALGRAAEVHEAVIGVRLCGFLRNVDPSATLLLELFNGLATLADQHANELMLYPHDVGVGVVRAGPFARLVQCLLDHLPRLVDTILGTTEVNAAFAVGGVRSRLGNLDSGATVLRKLFDGLAAFADQHADEFRLHSEDDRWRRRSWWRKSRSL
mmetsp:Transcript_95323/g.269465  ORF Transcript_95323/g.269465 Transcript_95323/m.269465 type:complete len:307 (-) Transcript_95323:542-1462(-)